MGKRKLSNEKLYEVVQQVSEDTKPQEIESLLLQVCTRIKNHEPLPQAMVDDGYPAWDHALLEIFRNLRRPTRHGTMTPTQLRSSTKIQTLQWSNDYIPFLQTLLTSIVKNFTPGNRNNSGIKEDKTYIDAWFEMPDYPHQLPSIGFSKKNGHFYWCIGHLPAQKQSFFLTAGYYLWNRDLYKDFNLPINFFDFSASKQEKWFLSYISELIQEFDRLYQTN